jgi:uncharacterized OB-fold protein
MLFNCFSCGKLISLKKELCPYCMVDLNAARESVEVEVKGKKPVSIKKKYTFFSLLSR